MNNIELKELRQQLKLTQTELAAKLGISLSALWKLEAGVNKMSKPVAMLAEKLKLPESGNK